MKKRMSRTLLGALAAAMGASGVLGVSAAHAAPICLQVRNIANSQPNKAGTWIDFTMQDGKVWRNTLQGRCPDLWFNGFVWVVRGTDIVCGNQQSLKVLHSGQICVLGKFTQLPPKPKPAPKGG